MFQDKAVGASRDLDDFVSEVISLLVLEMKYWCSLSTFSAVGSE